MSSIRNILDIWFDEYQKTIVEYKEKDIRVSNGVPLYEELKKHKDNFVQDAYVDASKYNVILSVGQTGGLFANNPSLVIKGKNEDNPKTVTSGRYVAFLPSSNGGAVYLAFCYAYNEIKKLGKPGKEINTRIIEELRRIDPPKGFLNEGKPVLGIDKYKYADTCAIYKEYKSTDRPSDDELKADIAAIMGVYEKYLSDNGENGVKTEVERLLRSESSTQSGRGKTSLSDNRGGVGEMKSVKGYLEKWEKDGYRNKQIVFTGPPGTSKTYWVRNYLKNDKGLAEDNGFVFVQFHPSYDYTDFVEGLRPVEAGGGVPIFARVDGTFKSWCRKIVERNLDVKEEGDKAHIEEKIEKLYKAFEHQQKIEERGSEGEGDTLSQEEAEAIKGWQDKCEDNKYFFIIDEINRADLSKVFGELMFGLEESYRGVINRFDTQYQNLDTYVTRDGAKDGAMFAAIKKGEDCFRKGFFIPENLYIIGTMNDIDRSVETFDFALRRRFRWYRVDADAAMGPGLRDMAEAASKDGAATRTDDDINDMIETMKNLNKEIGDKVDLGLNPNFCIGPAYLRKWVKCDEEKDAVWDNRIKPLLFEYCRGYNKEKVEAFVEDELKPIFMNMHGVEATPEESAETTEG